MLSIQQAVDLITNVYDGRTDLSGERIVNHSLRIALRLVSWGCNHDTIIAGIFHDLQEDHKEITDEQLLRIGTPERTLQIVKLVTRNEELTYGEYMDDLLNSNDLDAVLVKYADNLDNGDAGRWSRIRVLTEKHTTLISRYEISRVKIEAKLIELGQDLRRFH